MSHKFSGIKQNEKILITGSYDINIWYSVDNDTLTDVYKETIEYNEIIKMKDDKYLENGKIKLTSLTDPKCNNIKIEENKIKYDINLELGIELLGDTKVKIIVDENLDDYNIITERNEETNDIDNINTNYLEK